MTYGDGALSEKLESMAAGSTYLKTYSRHYGPIAPQPEATGTTAGYHLYCWCPRYATAAVAAGYDLPATDGQVWVVAITPPDTGVAYTVWHSHDSLLDELHAALLAVSFRLTWTGGTRSVSFGKPQKAERFAAFFAEFDPQVRRYYTRWTLEWDIR